MSHNPFPIPMEEVYKIAQKAIGRYMTNRVMNDDYDDLVQDTIIRAMHTINSFDPKRGSFSNFLFMQADWVIWREKIHMQGKGREEFLHSGSLDYKLELHGEEISLGQTISVDDEIERKIDQEQKLEKIIDFMNPYEKMLFYDYFIENKSARQMGREQELPATTMAHRVRSLIKKLRRYINENKLRQHD